MAKTKSKAKTRAPAKPIKQKKAPAKTVKAKPKAKKPEVSKAKKKTIGLLKAVAAKKTKPASAKTPAKSAPAKKLTVKSAPKPPVKAVAKPAKVESKKAGTFDFSDNRKKVEAPQPPREQIVYNPKFEYTPFNPPQYLKKPGKLLTAEGFRRLYES